jgi:hypothetical protein
MGFLQCPTVIQKQIQPALETSNTFFLPPFPPQLSTKKNLINQSSESFKNYIHPAKTLISVSINLSLSLFSLSLKITQKTDH